jgi:hypothetical protein
MAKDDKRGNAAEVAPGLHGTALSQQTRRLPLRFLVSETLGGAVCFGAFIERFSPEDPQLCI